MEVDSLKEGSQQVHLEKVIDHITESISHYTGRSFFNQLVQSLSRLLRIDYVAICEFIAPMANESKKVRSISVSYKGTQTDQMTYNLLGTPFENLTAGNMLSYEQGARNMFPQDKLIQKHGIEACAGISLTDSKGQAIGIFLALHRKPFEEVFELRHILKLFSFRASLELERMMYERKMEALAYIDELTQLPNRNQFMDRMEQCLLQVNKDTHKFALLNLDLDRFKKINETEGYEAGDLLLQLVAERLKTVTEASNYTLSRVGGDKFSILIPLVEKKYQVSQAAEEILKQLQEPFILNENEYYLRASIGISLFPDDGANSRLLFLHADQAINEAKKHLGNTYEFYTPQRDVHITKHASLEKKLYKALERNELSLHYQPQIDAKNQSIIGWEVLLRWKNEEVGAVPPSTFIPIIEDTGLIIPIGYWIIEQACLKIKEWESMYPKDVCMMINVSAYQLLHYNFAQKVHQIMDKTGVRPEQLGFEITENISLHGIESALSVLRELKAIGLKLALDDFGTGYSALSYLKHFPIDVVKIDRSFVKDLSTDQHSLAICRSIIDVCHSLDFKVLAEGVEQEEQSTLLRKLGCDAFQGYYYSPPMPSAEVMQYVQRYSSL